MSNPSPGASVLVAAPGETAFLKISGRANFTASVNFKTVINELRERGVKQFVFDLTGCSTMDSTFLGVLAGFALKMSNGAASSNGDSLKLVNPNARVSDLLDNLGVSHLFASVTCAAPIEGCLDPALDGQRKPSREEVSKTCLEAHQTLMEANPGNIPKFKEVVRFLAEDLHKTQTKDSSTGSSNGGLQPGAGAAAS